MLESATKYISAGRCIGGIVIIKHSSITKKVEEDIYEWIRVFGQFVGKDHCQLYLDGLKTMKERLFHISNISIRIATFLEEQPVIDRVMFPTLPSHPTYNLAKEFLKLNPGCIWFHYPFEKANEKNISKNKIRKHIEKITQENAGITLETSYGSKYCKIDPWPQFKDRNAFDFVRNVNKEDKDEKRNRGVWFRLAIGYESEYDETVLQVKQFIQYLDTL